MPFTAARASDHALSAASRLPSCFSACSRASHTCADVGMSDVYFRANFRIFSGGGAPGHAGEVNNRMWVEHKDGDVCSRWTNDCSEYVK